MAEKRKRKIDDECRQFKEEWKLKYFVIKSGEKALCVICNETFVMKEFNMRRHFQSKHQEKYAQLEGEVKSVLKVFLNYKINSHLKVHCSVN